MVSTRLMTITTGPGNSEDVFPSRVASNPGLPTTNSNTASVAQQTAATPTIVTSTLISNTVAVSSNRHHFNNNNNNSNTNSSIISPPTISVMMNSGSGFNNTNNGSGTGGIITGCVSYVIIQNQPKNLLDLPVEVLDHIFSYVGYKKTAQLRVVSRQMNTICASILNSTFQRLQNQLLNHFQTVKAKMPRRESARRNHPLACENDIIETCFMRLSLLQMTFGKHIERKHCCFFPGGILDEVYNVLNYIRTTPKLARPFKATDELFDLTTMAMEYFKEYIEPYLPSHFSANTKPSYLLETKPSLSSVRESNSSSVPSPPQSNMVLRKGIRKIKQGMKRYNNQLSVLRNELRTCKRKATEQAKQISDQQKLLAEQQKQTMEYANRLDENDKKNEEMSRKFSTLLQELNKCKTELQYWRSKSPATPVCISCGQLIAVPAEEMEALVNQGVKPEDMGIEPIANYEEDYDNENYDNNINNKIGINQINNIVSKDKTDEVQKIIKENNCLTKIDDNTNINVGCNTISHIITPISSFCPSKSSNLLQQQSNPTNLLSKLNVSPTTGGVISSVNKRRLNDDTSLSLVDNNKKARRVQIKNSNNSRCQTNVSSISTSKGRK